MAWLRFTADFDYTPAAKPAVTIAFKAGRTYNTPRGAVARALELGVAVKTARPAGAPADAETADTDA